MKHKKQQYNENEFQWVEFLKKEKVKQWNIKTSSFN